MKNKTAPLFANIAKISFASFLALSTAHAFADTPSLSFVEVNHSQFEEDELGVSNDKLDFDGFGLAASLQVSPNVYIPVSYSKLSSDFSISDSFTSDSYSFFTDQIYDLDLTEIAFGLGYKFGESENGFFTVELGYYNVEVDVSGRIQIIETFDGVVVFDMDERSSDSETLDGFYGEVGYQHLFDNGFQTNVGVLYRRLSEDGQSVDDTSVFGELLYNFTENFSVKAGYETGDSRLSLGVRYNF